MFHQLYNSQFSLFDLENFFFNCYFASMIYYAGSKLINQIYTDGKLQLQILRISYVVVITVHFGLFIASVIVKTNMCLDFWYLSVRLVGFFMALLFCGIGKVYQIRAERRLKKLRQQQETFTSIHNPLPRIWCWVLFNLFGQTANIVKSFVFVLDTSLHCTYDKNNGDINYAISLVMEIITFYLPLASSIYMFWIGFRQIRNRNQSHQMVQTARMAGIEMTAITSPMARVDSF